MVIKKIKKVNKKTTIRKYSDLLGMVWVCFHYVGNLYSLFDTNLYAHHHQRSQTKESRYMFLH